MKKLLPLLTLFLLLSYTGKAQLYKSTPREDMTMIKVSTTHYIAVEDTLMERVVRKFLTYIENNPIDYEQKLSKLKTIVTTYDERANIAGYDNGVIILNKKLDSFPSTKEIVILHHLSRIIGMRPRRGNVAHVQYKNFHISNHNEDLFTRQLSYDSPYKYIVKCLKIETPLKSKL